eukprot:COSAG02_NODE_8936_length_2393_cov_14.935920_2_plen_84_part_00
MERQKIVLAAVTGLTVKIDWPMRTDYLPTWPCSGARHMDELNTILLTSLLLHLLQLVRWLGHATVTPTNQSDTTSLYGIYRSC